MCPVCCVRAGSVTCALTCASMCTRQRASISTQPVAVPAPARVSSASCAQPSAPRSFGNHPPELSQGKAGISWLDPSFLHPGSMREWKGRSRALRGALRGPWHVLVLPKSSCCPDPGSQKSRSQQPWGRSYPTRPPAPCPAFPTSSEQPQLFTASPRNVSILSGHLHHFLSKELKLHFKEKEGGETTKRD